MREKKKSNQEDKRLKIFEMEGKWIKYRDERERLKDILLRYKKYQFMVKRQITLVKFKQMIGVIVDVFTKLQDINRKNFLKTMTKFRLQVNYLPYIHRWGSSIDDRMRGKEIKPMLVLLGNLKHQLSSTRSARIVCRFLRHTEVIHAIRMQFLKYF